MKKSDLDMVDMKLDALSPCMLLPQLPPPGRGRDGVGVNFDPKCNGVSATNLTPSRLASKRNSASGLGV